MPDSAEPFIRIRGLTQSFGKNQVLRGVDLDIFRGETLAILGGSGCGKSVLLKPNLVEPTRKAPGFWSSACLRSRVSARIASGSL